jgi:hypothetical protein
LKPAAAKPLSIHYNNFAPKLRNNKGGARIKEIHQKCKIDTIYFKT